MTIFDDIRKMERQINLTFENLLKDDLHPVPIKSSWIRTPLSDFFETDTDYQINMELPGINKEDIKINVYKNLLEIEAENKNEEKRNKNGISYYERSYSKCYRSFSLPSDSDINNIDAKLENGILNIVIKKKPSSQEQKIKEVPVK